MNEIKNIHVEELKKFVKKEVVAIDSKGKKYKGICKSIDYRNVDIIIMTLKEKIFIKHPILIKRKRDYINSPTVK